MQKRVRPRERLPPPTSMFSSSFDLLAELVVNALPIGSTTYVDALLRLPEEAEAHRLEILQA